MRDVSGSLFFIYMWTAFAISMWYMLGRVVYVSVCTVADDSPTSDETGLAAEVVCSIGILMYVIVMNVFTAMDELWEGFETVKGLP